MFTLGFHEDHVTRRLHIHNALAEDVVVLFTVSPVSAGVRRAYEGVRGYVLRIGLSEPKLVEVPFNPPDGIFTIVGVLKDVPRPLIVDVSGGMRFLGLLVVVSLLFMGEDVDIYVQPEGGDVAEVHIPRELFEFMRRPLSSGEVELIKTISEYPGITLDELAEMLGKSEKTVRNLMTRLRKLLVIQKGRYAGLYPTKWVKVVTNLRPKHEEEITQTP